MSSLLKQYESKLDAVLAKADRLADSGPAWLQALRREGLRTFREHGVPTPKHEEWKYTPLRSFSETEWRTDAGLPSAAGAPWFEAASVKVLLTDGCVSAPEGLPAGLRALPLSEALAQIPDVVEAHLGQAKGETTQAVGREIRPDVYPFGALNTALIEDGLVLIVEDGAVIGPLIEIVVASTATDGRLTAPRILVIAEDGSQARIVEQYVTEPGARCAVVPVTEVFIGAEAKIEHVRVQDQASTSTHIGLWQTRQGRDSVYTAFNVVYGGSVSRLDQVIWIGGEGTETRLDGVVCANGEQHMDNHTRLDHAVPNCNSFEIYKQIVDDKATIVFNGKIFVHQDAQKTDAKQTNQALLLSPTATIDSKPQLEIFADDVKCTHGATVGQIEDTPMFYMRSRGVPRDTAEAVLVYAFAAEVLELITVDSVRESLERKLYQKLGVDLT